MSLKKRVAVLGAGVVGLSSAVNIQVTFPRYINLLTETCTQHKGGVNIDLHWAQLTSRYKMQKKLLVLKR